MGQAALDQMPQPARADDRMWMSEETKCAERNLLDSGDSRGSDLARLRPFPKTHFVRAAGRRCFINCAPRANFAEDSRGFDDAKRHRSASTAPPLTAQFP
jgi:hypothetical protein